MNQFIMALTLLIATPLGVASVIETTPKISCACGQSSTLVSHEDMTGQKEIQVFDFVSKNSEVYTLLAGLKASVPDLTQTLEYVVLLNEVHLVSQQMSQILIELQKNNKLNNA